MFANPKKYNPALLDRVAGSLKGSTMYAYQTQFTLDHILSDSRFFLDSNGNFGAGDTITINRYDDSGPLPVHTHTLLERIICIVKQSDRQGVHIRPLPDQYLDMEAFEAEWQAEKAGPAEPMTVEQVEAARDKFIATVTNEPIERVKRAYRKRAA